MMENKARGQINASSACDIRRGVTDQQTDGWTDARTDSWTDGRTDKSYRNAWTNLNYN